MAVMGHVDHGKTTLLSTIRQSDLTAQEFGGITQHIGAYQITYKNEKITFIDTPGHAAFSKMRSQGAGVTDLVVLVVAADDGVKPQTKESLVHIKAANVPFLVAINKIDLPGSSIEMVKAQLAEVGVLVEGYGGKIVCVPISAKLKKGIDELLEMILLMTKMQELKADPGAVFRGVVIDAKLDTQKGPVATVLVQQGTLKIGTPLFNDDALGKVKALVDENGKAVAQAQPAKPVLVLGFKKIPAEGTKVFGERKKKVEKVDKVVKVEKKVEKVRKVEEEEPSSAEATEGKKTEEEEKPEEIKIILKADTEGMLQALKTNIPSEVTLVLAGTGQVTESDVLLALSTQAKIVAFNVKIPASVAKLAGQEKVLIKSYQVIYELLEDLEKRVLKMLEPTIDEEVLGEAEVIAEFTIKNSHICGCKIKKGRFQKKDRLHLKRDGKILTDMRIKSFQKEKQEVEEAKVGSEIGLVFSPDVDFKLGDVIIAYSVKV